jgi:hypothetical protein
MAKRKKTDCAIFAVAGGFYFFGTEIPTTDGFMALKNASMFGGFSGGKGLPGVARGDSASSVTLDPFDPVSGSDVLLFPTLNVYAVMPSVDLYSFKGTRLRADKKGQPPIKADKKIFAVAGGFYFFGTEIPAADEYLSLTDAAMFGGFSGGKGLPGVARGDLEASVTLDRFSEGETLSFPITGVYAVMPSIDLYTAKGTTIR